MSISIQKSVFRLALVAAAVLAAQSFAALPEMRITTKNGGEPQSKDGGKCNGAWTAATGTHIFDYIDVSKFQIIDNEKPINNITRDNKSDALRLRGNSTADAAKKPYRIKFGEKVSLFGKTEAKSWVLLANFYDGTFALNAIAFEMGKRMGLEFTNSQQLVDLYINDKYKGIYQLTEQIQSHKGRVDLKENKKGWLTEFDYHAPASDECLQAFIADKNGYNITAFIKSPELDDTSFTKSPNDSSSLRFVKTDINNLVNKMKAGDFPNNGYRDLIDLESVAKYVLIQLVLDNFDFNSKTQTGGLMGSNYFYKVIDTAKIKAGPLWDFDLAAGVQNNMGGGGGWGVPPCYINCQTTTAGFPSHYQSYQDPVTPTSQNYSHVFYKRLWEDNVFKAKYKKLWLKHKSDFQAMSTLVDQIKSQVENSVEGKGANTWANNSMYASGTLTKQQFNTEVSNLKTWLNNRIGYAEQQINVSSIDVNWDIVDQPVVKPPTTSVASSGFGKAGSGLAVVKNGLKINAASAASVKVFTLNGAAVTRHNFAAGSHAVSLGNLPKGTYLVRVNLDGVKQTLKVPVR